MYLDTRPVAVTIGCGICMVLSSSSLPSFSFFCTGCGPDCIVIIVYCRPGSGQATATGRAVHGHTRKWCCDWTCCKAGTIVMSRMAASPVTLWHATHPYTHTAVLRSILYSSWRPILSIEGWVYTYDNVFIATGCHLPSDINIGVILAFEIGEKEAIVLSNHLWVCRWLVGM